MSKKYSAVQTCSNINDYIDVASAEKTHIYHVCTPTLIHSTVLNTNMISCVSCLGTWAVVAFAHSREGCPSYLCVS